MPGSLNETLTQTRSFRDPGLVARQDVPHYKATNGPCRLVDNHPGPNGEGAGALIQLRPNPTHPRVLSDQPQVSCRSGDGFNAIKTGVTCDRTKQDVEIAISRECFDDRRPRHDSRGSTGPMAASTVLEDGLNAASGSNTAGKLRPGLANGGVQGIAITRDEIASIALTDVVGVDGNPGCDRQHVRRSNEHLEAQHGIRAFSWNPRSGPSWCQASPVVW